VFSVPARGVWRITYYIKLFVAFRKFENGKISRSFPWHLFLCLPKLLSDRPVSGCQQTIIAGPTLSDETSQNNLPPGSISIDLMDHFKTYFEIRTVFTFLTLS
jgi:hypothetical protein